MTQPVVNYDYYVTLDHGNSPLPDMESWLQKDQDDGSVQREFTSSLTGGDESFGSAHQTYQNSLIREKKSPDSGVAPEPEPSTSSRTKRHEPYLFGRNFKEENSEASDDKEKDEATFEGFDSDPRSSPGVRYFGVLSQGFENSENLNPRPKNKFARANQYTDIIPSQDLLLNSRINNLYKKHPSDMDAFERDLNSRMLLQKHLRQRHAPNAVFYYPQSMAEGNSNYPAREDYLNVDEEQRGREMSGEYKNPAGSQGRGSQILDENEYYDAESPILSEEDDYNQLLSNRRYIRKRDESSQGIPMNAQTGWNAFDYGDRGQMLVNYPPAEKVRRDKMNPQFSVLMSRDTANTPGSNYIWTLKDDTHSQELADLMKNSQRALQEVQLFQSKLPYKTPEQTNNLGVYNRENQNPYAKCESRHYVYDGTRLKREDEDEQKNMKTGTDEGGGEYEDEEGKGHKDEEEYYEDADLSGSDPKSETFAPGEENEKYVKREILKDADLKGTKNEASDKSEDYELNLSNAPVEHEDKSKKSAYREEITLKNKGVDFKTKLVYGGDLPTPISERSVGSILFERLMRHDRRREVFQIGSRTGREVTTEETLKNAIGLAEKLRSEGVQKGDYILLIGKNSLNMNTSLLGAFFMGAIPVPLSNKTTTEEFRIILEFVKPKFFGCDKEDLFIFRRILLETAHYDDKRIFLLDQSDYADSSLKSFPEFIEGFDENWESFKPVEITNAKDELALVMKALAESDSGRVIGLTHYNINAVIASFDIKEKEEKKLWTNLLMVQKVTWVTGIYCLILACCSGQKLIVMPDFDEDHFGKTVEKYKVTTTFLYSSKLWQIYKYSFQDYDYSSCKYIHAVDGSLPLALTEGIKEKTGMRVRSCYGKTELTGLVLVWYPTSKLRSAGTLIPETYGKVLSTKTGQKVGPDERGELCFKGPTISKGYLNNEKARRQLLDKEGFLLTGHYGFYDNSGDFFVLDRVVNVIKYKEHSISPKELEGVIKSLESVKDVCVAGIKHSKHGHYPMAFVALQKNKKLSKEEIIDFVNGKVPDFKKLRGGVVFVSKIPRTRDTGAIRRMLFDKVLEKYRLKDNVSVDDDGEDVKV